MGKELQPMDISSPGQNLESYLNSIQNISILTPEEEKQFEVFEKQLKQFFEETKSLKIL